MDGQGTKRRRYIAKNFSRLSRAHKRYRRQTTNRQTDDRRADDDIIANVRWLKSLHATCIKQVSCAHVYKCIGPEIDRASASLSAYNT